MLLLEGHEGRVTSVRYSPRGELLASSGVDGTVRLWDRTSAQPRHVLRDNDGPVRSLAFTADGRKFASAGDDAMVRIYDADSARLRITLTGSYWPLSTVAFSPEGDLIVAGSSDRVHGSTVVAWEPHSQRKVGACQIGHYEIHELGFAPRGRHVAIASSQPQLILWSPSALPFVSTEELAPGTPELLRLEQQHGVRSATFSSNKQWIATADGQAVNLFERRSGRLLGRFDAHTAMVNSVAFAAGMPLLASGADDGLVCLWDAAARREAARYDWQIGPVANVVVSPDGLTAAAAGQAGLIMWDV
jgi:WD40 repeat protein